MILDVVQVEFHEGSHTLWVHAHDGSTVLRIKCTCKINVDKCCMNPFANADIMVEGDINICISPRKGNLNEVI